jgi:hypothetical protein
MMNFTKGSKLTLIIAILSISLFSNAKNLNDFKDTGSFITSYSDNSTPDNSFYENYQSNWKNIKENNKGHLWNSKATNNNKISKLVSKTFLDEADKQAYLLANGYSALKSNTKVILKNNFNKSSSSNVCTPDDEDVTITADSGWGISRSTINNSGLPSFCLDITKSAPNTNDTYNTTLNPSGDITFNNPTYNSAQIIERVQRTIALFDHSSYAPSSFSSNLLDNFYRSVQLTIWHWTNGTSISNRYSWIGQDGNSYNASNIVTWVNNGTLQATDVFWLIPTNNNNQPEVLINQTTRPPTVVTNITICSDETYTWSENNVTYNGSNGNTSVTVEGSSSVDANGAATCAAHQTLNITVTPEPTPVVTDVTICSDETYVWAFNSVTYNGTAGTQTVFVEGANCAADQTLNITVTPEPADIVTNITINSNETYNWSENGITYNGADGDQTVTIAGVFCDADKVLNITVICVTADNTTSTASITGSETKTLTGSPSGGIWAIVSGGGNINGTTYTPSNVNSNTNVIISYTIPASVGCSETSDNVTFTVINLLGSIGDTVWYDTDGDGILDAGEPRLEGATVTLDPGTQGDPSDDITTTTDANGNYLFSDLPAGNYIVTVSVSTVTAGVPAGKTVADLVQTFDNDGLGSPGKSYVELAQGENNLDQDFAYVAPSGNTTGGNGGGVESESLGDAISKIYVGRKKNSVPTIFVKSEANKYNKSKLVKEQPYQGKGQTMLDMFPTELFAGNVANVTSPTDILDYTVADEVLSVDFSIDGKTKGVVLGIKTSDKVYNHTKASCDRLRGAEVLNIQKIQIEGYNFLMQGLKQRSGEVEYAVSFAASKNNNDTYYNIQTNWYVNNYTQFNDMFNFQVWATRPEDTKKLVADVLNNLKTYISVKQVEKQKFPETYASKIYRDKGELVVELRSTKEGNTAEVSMVELYSETANNIKHRNNSLTTEIQQALRLDIADGYEYDSLIKVDGDVEDAFYHADGNWGLDYDKQYTEINNYFVWNDFDREYQDDEYTINRNVEIKATSNYDYLTIYKSLLPGTISADYSEYKYLAFTAKGSGLMELGLIKSSVENWKEQYRVMVDLSEEEQTYYVPFEIFSSTGSIEKITADDLTTLTFTFLPVEANTKELDLFISDVKFAKTAPKDQTIGVIEEFENNFMAYPNPSKGDVNVLLFSKVDTKATVSLHDVTGKEIYSAPTNLTAGKNEIEFNVKVKPGIMFLKVNSKEVNYGTSKVIFR